MRVTLLLAAILALGLLGSTDALCDLKSEDNAVCQKLEDVKHIDSYKLTNLKASVQGKTLRSTSLKILSPLMKSLDLSDGEIEIIEPGTFVKMNGLRDLKMSDNSIAELKESALEGLHKLKNFDLRRNNIRQLPPALTKLEGLKNLEVSGNPLICNCATLSVRDDLLANGVKISKKVFCRAPSHLKGVPLLEPEAEVICMFEEQDAEMQADEAAGSGDAADALEDDIEEVPDVPSDPALPKSLDTVEATSEIPNDDLIIPAVGRRVFELPAVNATETSSNSDSPINTGDFEFGPTGEEDEDALIVEGSGVADAEEDGSGEEGSGTDGLWDSPDPSEVWDEGNETSTTSTTAEPTTEEQSLFDTIWSVFTTNEASTSSSKLDPDESATDEGFIAVSTEENSTTGPVKLNIGGFLGDFGITEENVVTKKADILAGAPTSSSTPDSTTKSDKNLEDFAPADGDGNKSIDDGGAASTGQSKRSMGSYVVLAALLAVLAVLIGFAAYKSSFCKKSSNDDPERGSELKDVTKSLLDTNNGNQPKIASNGNKENAPLVEPQDTWAGPQEIRQWTDNGQSPPTVDNGNIYTPPPVSESDPIKPPRKSLPPQEETNGFPEVKTHSPMSSFVPRTNGTQPNSVTPPNSLSNVNEYRNHSPPLSPNTQRVKITLQENPDSVPKTPILITRTKPGVNLVKSP